MAGQKRAANLMLPPPLPKPKVAGSSSDAEADGGKKKINLGSGMISGRGRGGFTFGSMPSRPRFGVAGAGRGGHVVHKASKRSNLPVIEGSPVKPAGGSSAFAEESDEDKDAKMLGVEDENEAGSSTDKGKGRMGAPPIAGLDVEALRAMVRGEIALEDAEADEDDPKEKFQHGVRRASMISRLLSQSVSEMPETPPRKTPATEGKGKARASSGTFPQSSLQNTAPGALGKGSGVGARVSANTRGMAAAVAAAGTSPNTSVEEEDAPESPQGSNTKKKHAKTLKILTGCKVFVDVRNEWGADTDLNMGASGKFRKPIPKQKETKHIPRFRRRTTQNRR